MLLTLINNHMAIAEVNFEFLPETAVSNINPVKVSFNGIMYADSWWFSEVAANKFSPSVDELFIINAITQNRNGTLSNILNLWQEDEKQEINDLFSDKVAFDGNQGFYKKTNDSAFISKIAYGQYLIFIIQHTGAEIGNIIEDYPVVSSGGKYYLTNKLKDDLIYAFLVEKIKKSVAVKTLPVK